MSLEVAETDHAVPSLVVDPYHQTYAKLPGICLKSVPQAPAEKADCK